MLSVALRTLRVRWTAFTGSFVALALGVGLLTVMGLALASSVSAPERPPGRLAAAPVVVTGQDTLRVPTPAGERTARLAHPRPIPAVTVARLRKLGPVVTDRSAAGVHRLGIEARPAAVREVVGDGARVLTGTARRLADPGRERDREALTAMNALFGTAGGVSAFVSVFVVASTFAFAVAQRRREFALLRTAGATPGQIRRTVLAEALTVGVLASAAGCALGSRAAPLLTARLAEQGLAPAWFTVGDHVWPYHAAFWTGLCVALCGAAAASWRAGRTAPAEALREASADRGTITRGRLLCGTALLLTAAVTLALALARDPGELLHRKTYVSRPMLLITAAALLSPLCVRPLTRLLTRLPGVCALLVRENTAAGVRRGAALAAPVLVTVALAGSLLGTTATLDRAKAAEARERTTAAFVVLPADGTGFDAAALRRLRAVPGAVVSPSSPTAVHVLEDGVALIRSEARAVAPAALAATARPPLAAGRVGDLDDDSIIVNEEWRRHRVGERVRVWLGDGTPRTLRIAAVMPTGTGGNGAYVTERNAPGARADRVDVALAEGADPAAVATALRAAAGTARVLTRDAWLRASHPGTQRTTRLGLLLVLGIALLYTGISVAGTTVMGRADQVRDTAVLRLAGATRGQVLRLAGAEALTVVAAGALLGLLVTAVNLAGLAAALALQSAPPAVAFPWRALGATTAACALLAVTCAVVPTAATLRRRAVDLAAARP
ncbi:FtsX-like permease family protein [Streptomyces sp. NPDC052693]|uniref:FtsX-like permease family protein n=1 Tax=Streptomyces sp. NPDC052693 TaxID=3155814 RepID=UPI003413A953